MLDILRRHAGSWAIKIALTFIAVTFVWWGVGTYAERERETAATVGRQRITVAELNDEAAGLEKVYREVYGPAYTPEMARALDLRRQALETLIRRTILLSEARALGLVASDTEVQREIAATPAFQVDGAFREDRYQSVLRYNRITPAEYEDARRREITLRKMEGLLTASARATEAEARDYFEAAGRRVRLLVAAADPEKVKAPPAPGRAELEALYAKTREQYRIPARVKLLVARFDPDHFAKGVEVAEQEARSFYEGNADRFRTEERRLVARFEIPFAAGNRDAARRKASEAAAAASGSRSAFETAAKRYGRGRIVEAWISRKEARAEVADAVFSTPVDTVAGPVEVPGAFLVLRVERIRFPETRPFEQVREQAAALVRRERGKDLAVVKAYEAHARALPSRDLRAACAPYGITPAEVGPVSADRPVPEVPLPVLQEALSLPPGEVGPVKTLGEVHYLFQVLAKQDSRIPELSDVVEQVRADAARRRRREAARELAVRAASAAKSAAELERAARAAGLSVFVTPAFSPFADALPEPLASAGAEVRREVATLSPRAPVSPRIYEAKGRFLAVALAEEIPPDEAEWARAKERLVAELTERKRRHLLEAFLAERRRAARVEIHPDALK